MSLSAAVLFDRALKQTRRAALREQGLVPRPLPQIRIVRWLRAPRETFGAWSLMLLEGVRTLDEAVEEVREDRREKEQNRLRRREQEQAGPGPDQGASTGSTAAGAAAAAPGGRQLGGDRSSRRTSARGGRAGQSRSGHSRRALSSARLHPRTQLTGTAPPATGTQSRDRIQLRLR